MSLKKNREHFDSIHPDYSQKHYSVCLLRTYLLAFSKLTSPETLNQLLDQLNVKPSYFHKKTNWVSVKFFNDFNEEASKYVNLEQLNKVAGRISISPEFLRERYYVTKYFATPKMFVKAVQDSFDEMNVTRTCQGQVLSDNMVEFILHTKEGYSLPKDRAFQANFIAMFQNAFSTIAGHGLSNVKVIQTHNSLDGDDQCRYEVSWESCKDKKFNYMIALLSIITLSTGVFYREKLLAVTFISVALICLFVMYKKLKNLFSLKGDLVAIQQKFEEYQEDSKTQYSNLQRMKYNIQRSYDELDVLLQTNNLLLEEENIQAILDNSVKSLCVKFNFNRSVILLHHKAKNILKTSSLFSEENEENDRIWNFEVKLDNKRENPNVVSSVFYNQKTAVLNNVMKNIDQFNDESKALIRNFNATAFVSSPIVFKGDSIGVLIADKGMNFNGTIGDQDKEIIENICQQIGIALSKQMKIDELDQTLSLFKKYNPSLFNQNEVFVPESALGGKEEEIICMFCDIRKFTLISDKFPPDVTLSLLNSFYSIVQESVKISGGIIDKFIGDEVFVIWKSSITDPTAVMNSCNLIMSKLKTYNHTQAKQGLPEIVVGFGLHKGKVIMGNIGTKDRMDFTCIGKAVNVASRLQTMCKELNTSMVVSKDFYSLCSLNDSSWESKEVQIRGIVEKMFVYYQKYICEKEREDERAA